MGDRMTTLADLERVGREIRAENPVTKSGYVPNELDWADTIAAFVREQREREANMLALAEAVNQRIAKREWQPIETAPKCDCCPPVDAWVKSCLLGRFDGHGWITWVGQMDSGMWLESNSRRGYGDSEMPTHWMPLPPPPTTTTEENANG